MRCKLVVVKDLDALLKDEVCLLESETINFLRVLGKSETQSINKNILVSNGHDLIQY